MTNRDGGKGDAPRPLGINKDQFDKNWDEIFKKDITEKDIFNNIDFGVDVTREEAKIILTYKENI